MRVQEFGQTQAQSFHILCFTLPYNEDVPATFSERIGCAPVPGEVGLEFRLPERCVGFRGIGIAASLMPVPVTSVNENDLGV